MFSYASKLCICPECFGWLLIAAALCACIRLPMRYDKLISINGRVMVSLYSALILKILLPLKCHGNPNGRLTVDTGSSEDL